MTIRELQEKARQLRIDEVKMITLAGSGHPGGSLSVTDILVALYYSKMNTSVDAAPGEHDVCVLSKGHAAPALYAVLADKGYFRQASRRGLHHRVSWPGRVCRGGHGKGL